MILDEVLGGRPLQLIKQLAGLAEATEWAGGVPLEGAGGEGPLPGAG